MLTPKKNLVSLIRATVKPECQNKILNDIIKCGLNGTIYNISYPYTLHGISIGVWIDDKVFDDDGWSDGQKYKPVKEGIYKIRFSNGGEYLRRWKDGKWYDLTGTVESDVSRSTFTEFKWFDEDID